MEIAENYILACLIIDYEYLRKNSKMFNLPDFADALTKNLTAELVNLLQKSSSEKLGVIIDVKISQKCKFRLRNGHVLYNKYPNPIEKSVWKNYIYHEIEPAKTGLKCQEDEPRIIELCEIITEESCPGPKKTDIFIFMSDELYYEEIFKLCEKHQSKIVIAGLNENLLYKKCEKNILGFISFESTKKPDPLENTIPKPILYSINMTVGTFSSKTVFGEILEGFGLKPNKIEEVPDPNRTPTKNIVSCGIRIIYENHEKAKKAFELIKEGILGNYIANLMENDKIIEEFNITKSDIQIKPNPITPNTLIIVTNCCLCKNKMEKENIENYELSCKHFAHCSCISSFATLIPKYLNCGICGKLISPADRIYALNTYSLMKQDF